MIRRCALALLVLPLLVAARGEAVSIGLDPSPVATSAGSSFTLDLVVAGLGDGVAPSLSAFDLDILFDDALLALDAVVFGDPAAPTPGGTFLGGLDDSLREAEEVAAGTWNVSELTLLSPAELDALQPGSFRLATLSFTALAEGTTSVTLSGIAVDGVGEPITDLQLGAARVEIAGGAVVPEPGAALLFACGALAVARARRAARAG